MSLFRSIIRCIIAFCIVEFLFKQKDKSTLVRIFLEYVANNKYVLIIISMILLELVI